MFGEPVRLTYAGRTTIKTPLGGLLTLFSAFCVLTRVYAKIYEVNDVSHAMTMSSSPYKTLTASSLEPIKLRDYGLKTDDVQFSV